MHDKPTDIFDVCHWAGNSCWMVRMKIFSKFADVMTGVAKREEFAVDNHNRLDWVWEEIINAEQLDVKQIFPYRTSLSGMRRETLVEYLRELFDPNRYQVRIVHLLYAQWSRKHKITLESRASHESNGLVQIRYRPRTGLAYGIS